MYNKSVKLLLSMLHSNCIKIEEQLEKLRFRARTKRGLFNFVGTAIKYLTGNPDENDAEVYEKNFDILFKNQDKIVKQIDKYTSFANQITERYQQNLNIISSNIEATNKEFNKISSVLELNMQVQYQIHISENFLSLLNDINEIISLAKGNIVSTKLSNPAELKEIINHLQIIYKPEELLPFSSFHLFEILEVSQIEIALVKNTIVYILFIPILKENPFNLEHVYPIPNEKNQVLIPPTPYVLINGLSNVWTSERCLKYEDLYLCKNTENYECNLINPGNCTYAQVNNIYELYIPLENSAILTDFKEVQTIVEQCKTPKYFQLQFSNIIYSENKCKIIINNEIFSNKVLNFSVNPIVVSPVNHLVTKEVNVLNKHLENINDLKSEVKQLKGISLESIQHNIHISVTAVMFLIIIVLIICITYKNKLARIVKDRTHKSTSSKENEDILRIHSSAETRTSPV